MALVSVLLTEILLSILRNIYTKRRAAVYQHKFPASGHTGVRKGWLSHGYRVFPHGDPVSASHRGAAPQRQAADRGAGPIELVLTLLISDLASVPMQDFGLPLLNRVIPIITLIALSTLFSAISLRCVRFRDLVCGQPALVIGTGSCIRETMRRNRLTLDELFEQMRGQGITNLNDVEYAILETNGRLSVLPRNISPTGHAEAAVDKRGGRCVPAHHHHQRRAGADGQPEAVRPGRAVVTAGAEAAGRGHSRDVFLLSVDEQGHGGVPEKGGAR